MITRFTAKALSTPFCLSLLTAAGIVSAPVPAGAETDYQQADPYGLQGQVHRFDYTRYDEDDEEDEDELEFAEFELYFELNNTDGDLGIHSVVDGDPWSRLIYEDTEERKIIDVRLTGSMAQQGLTEFFFESAEPTFDELSAESFFSRFPDGIYEAEGITTKFEEIESETMLSSVLPSPPVVYIGDGAQQPAEGCNDDSSLDPAAALDPDGNLPVVWEPVTDHHPTIGSTGDIEVELYQVAVEAADSDLTVDLDSEVTNLSVPGALIDSGDSVKIEVIVRDSTYNQVATEACVNVI